MKFERSLSTQFDESELNLSKDTGKENRSQSLHSVSSLASSLCPEPSCQQERKVPRKSLSRKFRNANQTWIEAATSDKTKNIGTVSENQPKQFYDLLPVRLKNPSFIMHADLPVPRTRFILQHRVLCRDFSELTIEDHVELVRLAMRVAKDQDILNASLSIPLGAAKVFMNDSETFYAYLIVPSIINFTRVFQYLHYEIPMWPNLRWVTPLWPKVSGMNLDMPKLFEKALSVYKNTYADREVLLAPTSTCVPAVPKGNVRLSKLSEETLPFRLFQHTYLPNTIAVSTRKDVVDSYLSRAHLLISVFKSLSKLCDLDKEHCHLSVSLGEPYRFNTVSGCDSFALLQFPHGIPESLKSTIRLTGSQRERLRSRRNSKLRQEEEEEKVEDIFPLSSSVSSLSVKWTSLLSKVTDSKEIAKEENKEETEGKSKYEKSINHPAVRWQTLTAKVAKLSREDEKKKR